MYGPAKYWWANHTVVNQTKFLGGRGGHLQSLRVLYFDAWLAPQGANELCTNVGQLQRSDTKKLIRR